MAPSILTQKELKDQDLILIHKSLLIKKLNEENVTLKTKRYILKYYNMVITNDNIRDYYNQHINVFLSAMINNTLSKITKYK